MADIATAHSDVSSGLSTSPSHKRKRGAGDGASPDNRRSKRGAAPAAVASSADPSLLENAVEATQAAAAVSAADFSALQQAAADHSDAADPANASSTAAAALGNLYPTLHVPPTTEETFAAQTAAESSYPDVPHDGINDMPISSGANGVRQETRYSSSPVAKPTVGSEEWHKMRKNNHKEVERRRRETINEGINELAKIVPNCEKNKGSILQKAVQFISQLKEAESQNVEKWTLEKLLTEQAIAELSGSNDKLKQECERLYRELETWKRLAQNAGLQPPPTKEDAGSASGSS